jgi:hypothetical protein
MDLKPNKNKIILSLLFTFLWYAFWLMVCIFILSRVALVIPPDPNCTDYCYLSPFQRVCSSGCMSLTVVALMWLFALAPFIVVYLILSAIEYGKK